MKCFVVALIALFSPSFISFPLLSSFHSFHLVCVSYTLCFHSLNILITVCSLDGVPFLMHDSTLKRTTNVAEVFPNRTHHDASFFTWAELQQLNAGDWFLSVRPTNPHTTYFRVLLAGQQKLLIFIETALH